MIVLDITVVNVALPSIQDDLGFTAVRPGLGRQRLPDRLRRAAPARRAPRRPARPQEHLPRRPCGVHVASLLCGVAQSQEMLVGARFIQGVGGAMTSAVVLGMIVTMFPEPRDQAKAIGVFASSPRPAARSACSPAACSPSRSTGTGSSSSTSRSAIVTAVLANRLLERDKGIGFGAGADVPGAVLITSSLMLGVYTIVKPAAEQGWGAAQTLLLGAVSLALLARVHRAPGDGREPADAAAHLPRAQHRRGEHRAGPGRRRDVRHVLPRLALPAEQVKDYSPLEIGIAFLPATLVMGTLSIKFSDGWCMRYGAEDGDDPWPRPDHAVAALVRPDSGRRATTWSTCCR